MTTREIIESLLSEMAEGANCKITREIKLSNGSTLYHYTCFAFTTLYLACIEHEDGSMVVMEDWSETRPSKEEEINNCKWIEL